MQTKMKVISKSIAAFLFSAPCFHHNKFKCNNGTAGLSYTNPQAGMYVFTGSLTQTVGNVWYWFDFGDGNPLLQHECNCHFMFILSPEHTTVVFM